MHLTENDLKIMELAQKGPDGINIFWMYWSAPEGATQDQARMDLVGKSVDQYLPPLEYGQFVPMTVPSWAQSIAHGNESDTVIVGGVGCTSLFALLYDADRKEYLPLKHYIEHGERPTVLSYTGAGWKKVVASVPFYAGTGPMYRVTLRSGKAIDVSPQHKLLTRQGYREIADLAPGDFVTAPHNLPATIPGDDADAPRCSETIPGYRDCCSSDSRQRDAQPRLAQDSDQDAVPLRDGVPLSSRYSCCVDGLLVQGPQHIPNSHYQTSSNSACLVVLHPEDGLPLRERAANAVPVRVARATQALAESGGNSNRLWQGILAGRAVDLKPKASSYVGNGLIQWSYSVSWRSMIEQAVAIPSLFLRQKMSHVRQPLPARLPRYKNTYEQPYSPPSDKEKHTSYDEIVNIEYIGEHDYYDIHVPIYNNYVAEGMVNHNSGKTLNMVMIAAFYCCMMPNFRFLGTAPLAWQADRSYKDLLSMVFDIDNVQGDPRRISRWVKQVRQRPYPTVEFVNGSSMEFKSVDGDARGILTWSGDMVVVDQAEDPSIDLSEMVGNLGSRIRGQVGGRARLGKLVLMANSAYNPELWEMFDDYDADPKRCALLLTSWDNPYLTKRQLEDMEKRYRTKEEANQKMRSHRPLPKGKEFTQKVVEAAQSAELDSVMSAGLAEELPGYDLQDSANAGIVRWVLPPVLGHDYILVGDPGQGNPPYRNSPPVMVFDITGFPNKPATLAYFNWVYGYGAYLPFINAMEYAYEMYRPVVAAFDATGMQKAFDELGVLDPNKIWEPLDLASKKMHMVLCAKVLLAKSLILFPESLYSVWNQLLMWQMPDAKLRQDIACCVFMVAYLLNSMLPMRLADDPEFEGIQSRLEQVDRWGRVRSINRRGVGRLHG